MPMVLSSLHLCAPGPLCWGGRAVCMHVCCVPVCARDEGKGEGAPSSACYCCTAGRMGGGAGGPSRSTCANCQLRLAPPGCTLQPAGHSQCTQVHGKAPAPHPAAPALCPACNCCANAQLTNSRPRVSPPPLSFPAGHPRPRTAGARHALPARSASGRAAPGGGHVGGGVPVRSHHRTWYAACWGSQGLHCMHLTPPPRNDAHNCSHPLCVAHAPCPLPLALPTP